MSDLEAYHQEYLSTVKKTLLNLCLNIVWAENGTKASEKDWIISLSLQATTYLCINCHCCTLCLWKHAEPKNGKSKNESLKRMNSLHLQLSLDKTSDLATFIQRIPGAER